MTDLPDSKEMHLYAKRNLEFFIKTFYLHFSPDIEILQTPAQPETDDQRLKRLILEKDSFFQSGLVILFNSAEIYLKSIIAEKSVYLLLKEVKDCCKNKSFFNCSTLDAAELHKIAKNISGRNFPPRFDDIYDALRIERNKVIHLGKSNSKEVRKDFLRSFLIFREEIYQAPLNELVNCLINKKNLADQPLEDAKKNFAASIISMMKIFFPLEDILVEIYKHEGKFRNWDECPSCNTSEKSLAVLSKSKSICLSCDFKIGL
ncbi:hypothetical protein [Morganella morganii]|uniref:hypothetical protein n=1 Tax=Morganella morganii TaxID=582 RepID=UPI00128E3AAF|nr:hypothetical protein [Morganella morganii]MQC09108.1 hypothetical protein [Morganella morganii]MQC11403.1 hypothetical protein [Morganella morganii]MQC16447.1 hypothetical protein [Morganella morganii]